MVSAWYEWLFDNLQDFIPRTTKLRRMLAPWVQPKTSHLIKRAKTPQSKQPEHRNAMKKLEQVQTELAIDLRKDQGF